MKAEFASIHSGIADDLILELEDGIHFFQFKYQQKDLTYSDFVGKENLIGKLAGAWKLINRHYGNTTKQKQIKICVVTNVQASNNLDRNIPVPKNQSSKTFQGFINSALIPLKKGKIIKDWKPAIDKWRRISKLSEKDFRRFNQCLSIMTGEEPKEESVINKDDANLLYKLFHDLIQKSSMEEKIEKTAKELKEVLGESRFKLKNIHSIPLPDIYFPITKSKNDLLSCIEKIKQGYVALLGSPGSGKTSLITDIKKSLPKNIRAISYYCHYIGDEPFKASRGERTSFYHDLTKLIDQALGQNSKFLHKENDLDAIQSRLQEQLNTLFSDYKEKQIKTIIFIDGLDHIERKDELKIKESFLSELPNPKQLKDGVVFVIGSQRLDLLKLDVSIKNQVENDKKRLVQITSLTRTETISILRKSLLHEWISYRVNDYLKNKRISNIYGLTEGHPLSTGYLIQWIKAQSNWQISDPDPMIKNLVDNPELINRDYDELWNDICKDKTLDMNSYIGEISRLQGALDFEWICSWKEYRKENDNFTKKFKHFFKRSSSGKWQFFHSSFRLFIIKKSIETWTAKEHSNKDKEIHLRIAERCLSAKENISYRWNSIYHFAFGGEIERVFKIGTQEFFLEQYLLFRPTDKIQDQISFCLKLAAENKKPLETMKYIFLSHRYLHAQNVWDLRGFEEECRDFLFKNKVHAALFERVESKLDSLESNRPFREAENANQKLNLINFLLSIGEENKAQDIYQDIEINDWFDSEFLQYEDNYSDKNKIELPAYWAYTALNFMDIEDVVKILSRFKWAIKSRQQKKIDITSNELNKKILQDLCQRLRGPKNLHNFDWLVQFLKKDIPKGTLPFWYIDLLLPVASSNTSVIGKKYYDIIFAELPPERLNKSLKPNDARFSKILNTTARMVSILLRSDHKLAVKYGRLLTLQRAIESCKEVVEKEWFNNLSNAFYELELAVTLKVIKEDFKDSEIEEILTQLRTPKTVNDHSRWEGFHDYVKSRLYVACIRGTVFLNNAKGKKPNKYLLETYLEYILTYSFKRTVDLIDYRWLNNGASQLSNFRDTIPEVASLGKDGIATLVRAFKKIHSANINFYDNIKEYLLEEFHRLNLDALTKKYKDDLLKEFNDLNSNTEMIEACFLKARICLKFGDIPKSINWLKEALKFAFSENSEKDHQLAELMEWLQIQLENKNKTQKRDILLEVSRQAILTDKTGVSGSEAAEIIFYNIFRINPQTAIDYLTKFVCPEMGWGNLDGAINHLIFETHSNYISMPKNRFDHSIVPSLVALFNLFCIPQRHHISEETVDAARNLVILAQEKGKISKIVVANRIIQAVKYSWPNSTERKKIIHAITSMIDRKLWPKLGINTDDIPELDDPALKQGTEQPYPLQTSSKSYHREEVIDILLKDFNKTKKLIIEEKADKEHTYRSFDWGEVLERGIHLLKSDQFNDVVELLIKSKDALEEYRKTQGILRFLILLYKRKELRNQKLAEDFAVKVMNKGSDEPSKGWVRHYDGEFKFLACHLLSLINFSKYKELIFNRIHDGLKEGLNIYGLVRESIVLSDIITKDGFGPIAETVAKDRETMFLGFKKEKLSIPCLSEESLTKVDNIVEAVLEMLIDQLSTSPNYLIRRSFFELEWFFDLYKTKVLKAVNNRLKIEPNELVIDRLLLFVEKLQPYFSKEDIKMIDEGLQACCHKHNYAIVVSSRKILDSFNIPVKIIPPIVHPPKIVFPPEKRIQQLGKSEDDTVDEYSISPVFRSEVKIIAESTGRTVKETAQILQSIMHSNGDSPTELQQREKAVQYQYSWSRSSYLKLHPIANRTAILKYLHYTQIPQWERYELPPWVDTMFRKHDPQLVHC